MIVLRFCVSVDFVWCFFVYVLKVLVMFNCIIVFFILFVNFVCLGEEVDNVFVVGVDWVYFDVMDNYYVFNLIIGLMVCQVLCKYGVIVLIDVYLMVELVDCIILDFVEVGVIYISFYLEVFCYVYCIIQLICLLGCKLGIVFNLVILVDILDWVLDDLDLVLLMLVNLGFGGQVFIFLVLDKLCVVCQKIDVSGCDVWLEIDGGVKVDNIGVIVVVGVDVFVVGLVIFNVIFSYQDVIVQMCYNVVQVRG